VPKHVNERTVPLLVEANEHPVPSSVPSCGGLDAPTDLMDRSEAHGPATPREGRRVSVSRGAFHHLESGGVEIALPLLKTGAIHDAAPVAFDGESIATGSTSAF